MLLKFKALVPDDISQNCQLYSISWKKTCWFFQRFIEQLSLDSKGEIVQIRSYKLAFEDKKETEANNIKCKETLFVLKPRQLH